MLQSHCDCEGVERLRFARPSMTRKKAPAVWPSTGSDDERATRMKKTDNLRVVSDPAIGGIEL
jgi:hypothetical protein